MMTACGYHAGSDTLAPTMTTILGQTRALETLEAALGSARFHHGWIFSGPRGVGKFTTALQVARILLDEQAQPTLAHKPSSSRVQSMIDSGTHPDLHIITKELAAFSDSRELRERKQMNISIDVLRENVIGGKSGGNYHEGPAYRTPMHGHGKVFIIDEAELLDQTGQNAMLKTLEEPPAETYFFLITSQPDRLLPTIRSRCQHVRFQRLDDESMRQWLAEFGPAALHRAWALQDDEDAKAKDPPRRQRNENATLQWVAKYCDGSPGMALLAIDYHFHQWDQEIGPMLAELDGGKFPIAMGDTLGRFVEEFAVAWVRAHGRKTTSKDAANKDGARHVLTLLASHARNMLARFVEAGHDATNWMAIIDLIRAAESQLESNVNMKLLMENLAVQWWRSMAAVAA